MATQLIAWFFKNKSQSASDQVPLCLQAYYSSNSVQLHLLIFHWAKGFSGDSNGKESTCNEGDLDLILGLRRSPGEGNGYPLQYSCLENPMDKGACWATVHEVSKSWTSLSY